LRVPFIKDGLGVVEYRGYLEAHAAACRSHYEYLEEVSRRQASLRASAGDTRAPVRGGKLRKTGTHQVDRQAEEAAANYKALAASVKAKGRNLRRVIHRLDYYRLLCWFRADLPPRTMRGLLPSGYHDWFKTGWGSLSYERATFLLLSYVRPGGPETDPVNLDENLALIRTALTKDLHRPASQSAEAFL
jgi:hypothetical protein